jgi:diguanylate cyclase (GGDEF)-like protein
VRTPLTLVAHFDAGERSRLAALLRDAGATVEEAVDGPSAQALARTRPFELALLSCMLPGVSGFELCRQFGERSGPDAPIPTLLLADGDDPYVRARARHVGAKRVLFGSPATIELRDLVQHDWSRIDPLDLSSRSTSGARNDRLIRDLLDAPAASDGSLLSRVTDALTGLVQRDYLALKCEEECKRASRYGQPLSLVAIEIAGFDELVAKNGAAVGDEAVIEVAGVLLCESRDVDVAGRAGPARFHMLLPATPIEGARVVASRIGESLAGRTINGGGSDLPIVVRMGVGSIPGGARQSAEGLVREAEADLATATLSSDGRGARLKEGTPVEPLPAPARAPAASAARDRRSR